MANHNDLNELQSVVHLDSLSEKQAHYCILKTVHSHEDETTE
jgi:hypothetical protein